MDVAGGKRRKVRVVLREVDDIPENTDERTVEHFEISKVRGLLDLSEADLTDLDETMDL